MATLYKADGSIEEGVSIDTLKEMQSHVGGFIEYLYSGDNVLIVNDEGRIRNLPLNGFMSSLYGAPLYGDIVMTRIEEIYEK